MRDLLRRICISYESVWLIGISLLAGIISYQSPIDYAESDPLGSLLTAQSLVQTSTIKLDEYSGREYVPSLDEIGNTGRFRRFRDHCYYFFPLGTPFLSIPFVFYANLCGLDMINPTDDAHVQNILSAGTVSITAILCYVLARCFFSTGWSVFLSVLFVFGSPFISTMGTALWSANTTTIFVLLIVIHISCHYRGPSPIVPSLLAGLFVISFICRPTALLVSIPACIYVFWYERTGFYRLLLWTTVFILPFIVFSLSEFGRFLPEYYLPYRLPRENLTILFLITSLIVIGTVLYLSSTTIRAYIQRKGRIVLFIIIVLCMLLIVFAFQFLPHLNLPHQRIPLLKVRSLYGHMASPGRGLLVFCPYLVPVLLGLCMRYKKLFRNPLILLSLSWLILHFIVVSRPFRWWGGHCFGSRLLTEAFPSAALLTLIVLKEYVSGGVKFRRIGILLLVVTGTAAVFINTLQGALNPYTARWNSEPDIDEYPRYLFSWRWPQFLAGPGSIEERRQFHESAFRVPIAMKNLDTHMFGNDITATSASAYFDGWGDVFEDEKSAYRILRNTGDIWFWIAGFERAETHLYIALDANVSRPSDVTVALNRRVIGVFHLEPGNESPDSLIFRDHLLRPKVRNVFSFSLISPDTSPGADQDSSFTGLRFRRLELNRFGLTPLSK